MIIIRYLVWEVFKKQITILFTLSLIFFCQKLIKILSAVVDGEIPSNLVSSLLCFGVPEIIQLILPLSLSLGLLTTLGKLYTENKITAMHACGLSKIVLIEVAIILALLTSVFSTVNVMWIGPWSSRHYGEILENVKANPYMMPLIQGKFQYIHNGSVIFIEKVNNNDFHNIFFAQLLPKGDAKGNLRTSVIIADSGKLIKYEDNSQVIILNKGTCFEGTAKLHDFHIVNFQNYQTIISNQMIKLNPNDAWQMDIYTLWHNNNDCARTELHWRITLILAVFMMALVVVPMSAINIRQGYLFSIIPVILLYLAFFLLQTFIKSNGSKNKFDSVFWMWMINIFYLLLAVLLNIWDTVLIRRVRTAFYILSRNNK